MSIPTVTWSDPSTAVASLSPLITDNGVDNVVVEVDLDNCHIRRIGSRFRQARFALDEQGSPVWLDSTGLPLYNSVIAWALAE
ncbi:hypothetical protein [Burkholderia pseudomallei]|uniref:hypothetical protein n=1 Tax=Burkholderia pseudomallei TaxID=28450 RepID=UPI002949009D|nr:hypothetical protein [Burkholderia pseudomallei]CAJ9609400.1 Uncharacterised protein [Burkholderia pseudomallei]